MDCNPPKCAKVKARCQCPNSWIEYLAHEAARRRQNNLPRLSIHSHAAKYGRLKQAGKFRTSRNSGVCKQLDTRLLCAWHKQRTRPLNVLSQTDSASLTKILNLTDSSIRDFPEEPRIKTALVNGVPVIIKVESIGSARDMRDFLYVTKLHSIMTAQIPRSVPKLFKAYFLKKGTYICGVQVMEHIDGITMEDYIRRRSPDWGSLARALKRMIDDLGSCKIFHVDLAPNNIMVELDSHGKARNVRAIDFELLWLGDEYPIRNVYGMLSIEAIEDDKLRKALITAYLKVDMDLPRNMADWEIEDFYEITEADRPVRHYTDLPKLPTIIS